MGKSLMKSIVYLICDGEKFKIGVTKKPLEKRLKELEDYVRKNGRKVKDVIYWDTYPICVKDICVLGVAIFNDELVFADYSEGTFRIRREAKKLLQKTENNYIIYSLINIDKKDILYFKHIHKSGKEEKFYFEYSPLLKCFIYFINKNNDKYFKTIQGNFYNSKSEKLIDKQYEINNKGENVINLSKIFKKAETISERHDRIINRYIKLHRPIKRITVDEFEENKKKSKDDSLLKNNNSKSQKLKILRNTSRSKSFLRIKGEPKRKSILKPSRSYINLKSDEKKIQFGKAKIKKYKNKKD